MATRPNKPAEAKTPEELGKAFKEAMDAAEAKDAEQPKPKKNGEAKAEPEAEPKKATRQPAKKLALNEVEGEIKEGGKVRVGVQSYAPGGGTVNRSLTIPKATEIVGPENRPQNVHVRDVDKPERTLCTLSTNWTSGVHVYPDDHFITCDPCARRLIAIKLLEEKVHEARRKADQEAREKARREPAEKKPEKAPAEQAPTVEAPAETPAQEAPKRRRRRRGAASAK